MGVRFLSKAQRKTPLCGVTLQAMNFVYLLESINTKKWYIGFTPDDPGRRLDKHNLGLVQSTKAFLPWRLIYFEAYVDRKDATGREKFLKSGAGRKFLEKQLKNYFNK